MDLLSPIADFDEIVSRVIRGEVFLYPTDTVAGIGCDASNEASVNRIFEIKTRDTKKSVSFAFSNINHMQDYVEIPVQAQPYLKLLPGALTLVLNQKLNSPKIYGISTPTIGARIPNVPWLLQLIDRTKKPIVTTSANISGENTQARFANTNSEILKKIDFAIPWEGELRPQSSTVISILDSNITLLREGVITKSELNKLTGAQTF